MPTDAYAVAIARTAEHLTSNGERAVTADDIAQAMFPFGPDSTLVEDIRKRLIKAGDVMIRDGYQAYPLKSIYFDEFAVTPPSTSEDAATCLAGQAKDVVGLGRASGEDDPIWEAMRDKLLAPVKSAFRAVRRVEGHVARGLIDEVDVDAAAKQARLEIETHSRIGQIMFPQLNAGSNGGE